MSSSRNYSKESRSYYSRSSSHGNNSSNRNRPLSSLLIERDFSSPSLAFDQFDDAYFFRRRSRDFIDDFDRRIRSRFNDMENSSFDFPRQPQINYRESNNSSSITRNIPVQYVPSSSNRREKVYKKLDDNNSWTSSSFQRSDNNFNTRENRISSSDWPSKQGIQYSDVPQHQRTMSTPNYYST